MQFDIESSIKIFKDITNNNIEIIKREEDNNNNLVSEDHLLLGEIIKEREKYYFIPFLNELDSERETVNCVPWLIYSKHAEPEINNMYFLKEGDILKLGNSIFKIKLIQMSNLDSYNSKAYNYNYDFENNEGIHGLMISGNSNHTLILNGQDNFNNLEESNMQKIIVYQDNKEKTEEKKYDKIENKIDIKKEKAKINKICRICYQEEDDPLINPLIKPCKCSGSMKYIHLKCLLSWLKSKTIRQQNNIVEHNEYFNSYFITKEIECELCKEQFPDFIKHNNIKYCLIDFDYLQENKIKKISNKMEQNYINTNNEIDNNNDEINNDLNNKAYNTNFIVLDSIYNLNDGNKYRCIVKFNKENKIIIGRALENQLVLNEITVSRTHCLLTLEKNKFGKNELKLEDYGSKFGTLILLQADKYEIIKGKPLHIQIGNVYFSMNIPEQKSFFSCCNANALENIISYENINSHAVKKKYKVNFFIERDSDDENDNEKESNKQCINIKNKENVLNKESYNIEKDEQDNNKNNVEENKGIKKDKIILNENNKNDLLLLNNKNIYLEDDKEKIYKGENENNDKDKRTVNIQIIKPKDIISNISRENKNHYTSPENRNISHKVLEMKTNEIPINYLKKIQKERENDIDSIIIVDEEGEKK